MSTDIVYGCTHEGDPMTTTLFIALISSALVISSPTYVNIGNVRQQPIVQFKRQNNRYYPLPTTHINRTPTNYGPLYNMSLYKI